MRMKSVIPLQQDMLNLDDIRALPPEMFPMMVLSNGYTSVFGFLISLTTKDFWNHFMWVISPEHFATQWWWFCKKPLDDFRKHSLKFWNNPDWTQAEKAAMQQFIEGELKKGKWATRYDVIGLLFKAAGIELPNKYNFCSERLSVLACVDAGVREWLKDNCSPSPEEVNTFLKSQPRFTVFGRIQPG